MRTARAGSKVLMDTTWPWPDPTPCMHGEFQAFLPWSAYV